MAENSDTVEASTNWDKTLTSKYLQALSATQGEAARDAGVGGPKRRARRLSYVTMGDIDPAVRSDEELLRAIEIALFELDLFPSSGLAQGLPGRPGYRGSRERSAP